MTQGDAAVEYSQAIHLPRRQRAQAYAAKVRERNKAPCTCDACRMNEMLPMVQRITERWGSCSA